MEKKTHRLPRFIPIIGAALLLILALIYSTGAVYFRTHFPFHTSFLGYDVSQRDAAAIQEAMQKESEARTLTILELDGQAEVIDLAAAIDYRRSVPEPDDGWVRTADAWSWPGSLWNARQLSGEEVISYDEGKLEETVFSLAALDPANVTPPQDAYLEWQDDICVIVPEVMGNELLPDRVLAAVQDAVESDRDTVDLAAEDCYRRPAILRNDSALQSELARYEAINFQTIEIDLTGKTVTLSPDDVLSFFILRPGNTPKLSPVKVDAFVQELKDTYDTYERQRPFVNRYGSEIQVGTRADTYGFRMDFDATAALLTETLEGHDRHAQIEPVWTNAGWARQENGSDIGGTYIEVSIADQYMWAYVDGEMITSSPVVTGTAGSHDTPRGVFRILYMQRNTTLVGDDYSSPVSYWMPLTYGGVGLHDATWRSSFGGSIYTYSGSHGCINLPLWAAGDLFWSFYAGTPVVVW